MFTLALEAETKNVITYNSLQSKLLHLRVVTPPILNYMDKMMDRPLGALTKDITKRYAGVFTSFLEGTPIDKHFYPLYVLSKCETAPTQQELGELLGESKVMMVRILDYLSERGMVKRNANPEDRRCYIIILTSKGKDLVTQIEKAVGKTDAICLSSLSAENKRNARVLLHTMLDNLSTQPANEYDIEFSKRTPDEN